MKTKICRHCNSEKPVTEFKEQTGSAKRLSERTGKIYLRSYCNECDRVMTIERQKRSYQKLKEKRLAYQRGYDQKNIESKKVYYRLNKERIISYQKSYQHKNIERKRECQKDYYHKNRDKVRQYYKEYRKKNFDKYKKYRQKYIQKKQQQKTAA
ncbi:MAG TPA: hypothetical protein VIQ00_04365 [Chitinophagaceae bacterium]